MTKIRFLKKFLFNFFIDSILLFFEFPFDFKIILSLFFNNILKGGNVLITNLIYGMVDFVCYIILPFIIDAKKIGRRGGTMIMMTISAVGCISLAVFTFLMMGEELGEHGESSYYMYKKLSAFVAKFGISGTFGLVYVYTGELYPTPIRGIAVGLCSAGGRIGGILSPLVRV